jgi:hypothetical protein
VARKNTFLEQDTNGVCRSVLNELKTESRKGLKNIVLQALQMVTPLVKLQDSNCSRHSLTWQSVSKISHLIPELRNNISLAIKNQIKGRKHMH